MCVAAAGAVLGVIGSVASAVGTIAGAQAQANAAEYREKQEALLAQDAIERGKQAEQAQRRKASALAGRQKAVMASSNIDLGSGSALQIIGDTAQLGELDAQVIRGNSKRESQYHMVNSELAGMEADAARTAGGIGAFSSLLSGAQGLADKWYKPAAHTGSLGVGFA